MEKSILGWREEVEPYKQDAIFWHEGRPSRGNLKDFMAQTRNQYHYSIRRVKNISESICAQRLLEASENGSVELLEEMKKIKG